MTNDRANSGRDHRGTGFLLLVINPGATSTKLAVYRDERPELETSIAHSRAELACFGSICDQFYFRKNLILSFLAENRIEPDTLSAVVGRGGLLRPLAGGTYRITEPMVQDLRDGVSGQHASNLGGIIAWEISRELGIPGFIVDPVVVDELTPHARLSGHPELPRVSIFHALNQKAVARRAAAELGKPYGKCRLIVVHMGSGVSAGAHRDGRVIDVNNALDGEGPFSPERSGGLPAGALVRLCFSGKYEEHEIRRMITGGGGLVAYLGTNDAREVVRRIEAGDREARLVFESMAYQIAKEIGALSTVLEGRVDAIVLSGGLACSEPLVELIGSRVSFIARLLVYPGEDEMTALAQGALRVLSGREAAKEYAPGAEPGDSKLPGGETKRSAAAKEKPDG